MATCISRRACKDKEAFKMINGKGQFGRLIWTELRCQNEVSVEGTICAACLNKVPKFKYQAQPRCDHGVVGGPYPADSKLYGSPYFLKGLKDGWFLAEPDEIRAKAAIHKACSNMPPRKKVLSETIPLVQDVPVAQDVPVTQPTKQKRAYNRKKPLEVKAPVEPEAKPETKVEAKPEAAVPKKKGPKGPIGPRGPKKVIPKVEIAKPLENPLEPKLIEIPATPLSITDWIGVKVKKLRIEGKDYYHDAISGKLYGVSVNGVGAYKGRYNAEKDAVDTNFPDSDCE